MIEEKYIAKTLYGLENILADELDVLGASSIKVSNRAINFSAELKSLYKINLASHIALRILKPIFTFKAVNPDDLYGKSKKFDWDKLISVNDTFAIDSVVNSSKFRHSKYAALKLKDAIVDQIRSKTKLRPNVNIKNPTFRINVHIENEDVTISLDSSGESLHKRGYRLNGEHAPLNEVLASGMILLSGWDKKTNFIDPMCGSGTLAIEAALLATNTPPNFYREKFGFMNWKSFDSSLFKKVKSELISKKSEVDFKIIASDLNSSAIHSASLNAKRAKVDNIIDFMNEDFFTMTNELESGYIITNPPYGERLKNEDINSFYKNIGDTLKHQYNNFDAWILSANKEALKHLGLKTSRRMVLYNGQLECKYHNYKMYKGSLKKSYEEFENKES